LEFRAINVSGPIVTLLFCFAFVIWKIVTKSCFKSIFLVRKVFAKLKTAVNVLVIDAILNLESVYFDAACFMIPIPDR
jgi:hypothetical protein